MSFQNIQTATNYVLDNNQHTIAVFIASCLHNNPNQNNQNEMPQDVNDDGEEEGEQELNEAFIGNNDALNNSDATDPEQDSYSFGDNNEDGEDGVEDFDLGLNDEAPNNDEFEGGKRRKTRKGRKGRKTRKGKKSKKQRGGMRYGTGVGSNCFEPNYSIYNTPALSLFPYKPN